MKKSVSAFTLAIAIVLSGFQQNTLAQTSGEVLSKAIAFYDSLNIWNDFSGKVNLMTAFAGNRNSGGEIIEIRTKEGFYQNTRPSSGTIRGIRNRQFFLEVDGNKRSPNKNRAQTIIQFKNWHYFHFGILMELKASGLLLGDTVASVKFQGHDCLALTFKYDANTIKKDFFKDSNWTIYLDPVNYSMRGLKEAGIMNRYAVFSGILKVNGLKLPLCRTYFNNEDDSFYMVDLFTSTGEK